MCALCFIFHSGAAAASYSRSECFIALKEANETGYWLELAYKTGYLDMEHYRKLDAQCTSLRAMLISSINTAKGNTK